MYRFGMILLLLASTLLHGQQADIDCTAENPNCPPIGIKGDPPYTFPGKKPSPFTGFADPCLRLDPDGKTIWMAYSYPHMHTGKNLAQIAVPGVEIHLAKSTDGGRTWKKVKNLMPSRQQRDADNREKGFSNFEVFNMIHVADGKNGYWVAVWLEHFLPEDGGFRRRPVESFRLGMARANSPTGFRGAKKITLGGGRTSRKWGVDVWLHSLIPDQSIQMIWNEPVLYYEDGRLYLVVRSLQFISKTLPDLPNSAFHVFSTEPKGDIKKWEWAYRGPLTTAADASALGGEGVTQMDISKARDGALLALLTPDTWSHTYGDYIHHGTKAVEIASLENPSLKYDSAGKPVVRAFISATDLDVYGPAAAGYDPASATGIVLTRRIKYPDYMSFSLHATGIHP